MSKIKQSPKLPPEERKGQLLGAAKKLFVKKGYRGTTTEEIARKAGLTKGALYYHFKKKEDILYALVQQMCAEHGQAMDSSKGKLTPVDIFRAFMRVYDSNDMADYRQVVDIWAQAIRIPRIKRFLSDEYVQAVDSIQFRLDKGFGRNEKRRRDMAVFTLALYEGLAVHKMMNPDLVDLPAQARLFERMLGTIDSSPGQKRKKRGVGK